MSHLVEFLYFIAEVVGGLYQQQLSAISLPHNVKSRRVGRKKEGKKERKRETYENNWDEEGESCLEVENRERSWLGGRKRKRDASYQNISMQSSCWCGEDCRLSTAAAAFSKLHRSVTQTCSTHYTINRHNNSHHCLWENRGTRKGLPFPCQFVQKSFIYPVIDPCHPFSFSRGAY